MVSTNDESPCGGCGDGVGDVHVCPEYSPHMRPFCGAPVGKEGYGQSVLCPKCESEFGVPTKTSRRLSGKARKATTTILNRKKVVRCMLVQEELSGIKGLMAAAVEKFHAISMLARGTQISLKLHFGGSRKKTFYTEEEGHRRFRLVGTRGANT
ncbi:hypothetical protein GQ600_18162 [Phytophthora cactorum]|nr:hypothetical protein GQ600_5205 [Phytophthora cactorum]KAF1783199.1 hypothetical protein GQ600_18162 [Phytophthora cactorum]